MPKKKKENPVFTYKVAIVPVRTPTKWTAGEWEKDKEAMSGATYTGLPEQELLGYQPVMMAYLDGKKYGIAQGLGDVFPNEKEALKSIDFQIGKQFNPRNQMFLAGEIVE